MPAGDVRHSRYRGGGGGGSYDYDDEGRGASKMVWEWFERNFRDNDYNDEWLFSIDIEKCEWLVRWSTMRYGLEDITGRRNGQYEDSRASRLVIKKQDKDTWIKFNDYLWEQRDRYVEQERQRAAERNTKWQEERVIEGERREAEAAKIERNDIEQVSKIVESTAGLFRSEIDQAFTHRDRVGYDGDWIEDVVDTYIDGSGFGYEQKQAVGVKIQITVSLDLSNSMYYNKIATPAAEAFRDIALTMRQLKFEHPGDLFVEAFTFAGNNTWDEDDTAGRIVRKIGLMDRPDEYFGNLRNLRPSQISPGEYSWNDPLKSMFNGEDTWIKYLFSKIEKWEVEHSDPGAVRIDLIITDAVLEHPYDIKEADVIQETRDGNLQSVMLNFLPEEDWLGSTLPKRCYQLKVDADNITGILRNVISEFIAVQL